MFRLVNLLVFITFLYSTVYAQSDDDFLSDFGGDEFEEIESELDFVTTNVVKEKFSDISIEKNKPAKVLIGMLFSLKSYTMALNLRLSLFSGELQGLRQYIAILI